MKELVKKGTKSITCKLFDDNDQYLTSKYYYKNILNQEI